MVFIINDNGFCVISLPFNLIAEKIITLNANGENTIKEFFPIYEKGEYPQSQ